MSEQRIQNLLLAEDESLFLYRDLFYKDNHGIEKEENGKTLLCIGKYATVDFSSYLNSVSLAKWKKYTTLQSISLCLTLQGKAEILLVGYQLVNDRPARTVLKKEIIDAAEKREFFFAYPENNETLVSFELKTEGETILYSGYYQGSFEENTQKQVELAIATTTCRKEKYITSNVCKLKAALLDCGDDISNHFQIHIVDNGNTLSENDFPSDPRIHFHPNHNTGGSGGYARGMIECRYQEPKATHVLLMDDDVMVLPDSIYRTYVLLKNLRPEYEDYFVGGAMLTMEEKNIQHEDIGYVDSLGYFRSLKKIKDHFKICDNLENERDYQKNDSYQAWWYCCIPMMQIEKNGLPLPLFIRGDDVEYSLRCKAKIITMNGICVWHMGFAGKFNIAMNLYQETRNLLIDQAVSGILSGVNLVHKVEMHYHNGIYNRDYVFAEMAIKALEDFLKGPDFIMTDLGEKILKENNAKNPKYSTFYELEQQYGTAESIEAPAADYISSGWKQKLVSLTDNGHRFWPASRLKRTPVAVPHDFTYTPGKISMRATILKVDPVTRTGYACTIDRERYLTLRKRFKTAMETYQRQGEEIKKKYREAASTMTSEEFWKSYLEI